MYFGFFCTEIPRGSSGNLSVGAKLDYKYVIMEGKLQGICF